MTSSLDRVNSSNVLYSIQVFRRHEGHNIVIRHARHHYDKCSAIMYACVCILRRMQMVYIACTWYISTCTTFFAQLVDMVTPYVSVMLLVLYKL